MRRRTKAEPGADMRTAYAWMKAACEVEREDNCRGCPLMQQNGQCAFELAGCFPPAEWEELQR